MARRKNRNRVLALLFVFAMVFSLFANVPVTVMAAEQDTASSSVQKISGTDAFWRVVDDDTLVISGTGDLVDYATRDVVPWKNYQNYITTVQIGCGITRLGNWNFAMPSVTAIYLPSTVTEIADKAFGNRVNGGSVGKATIYYCTADLSVDYGSTYGAGHLSWQNADHLYGEDGICFLCGCGTEASEADDADEEGATTPAADEAVTAAPDETPVTETPDVDNETPAETGTADAEETSVENQTAAEKVESSGTEEMTDISDDADDSSETDIADEERTEEDPADDAAGLESAAALAGSGAVKKAIAKAEETKTATYYFGWGSDAANPVKSFYTIDAAIDYLNDKETVNKGTERLYVLADVTEETISKVYSTSSSTGLMIDLNGHSLTITASVEYTGTITVYNSSTTSGTLTINGGTYTTFNFASDTSDTVKKICYVNIQGGTFENVTFTGKNVKTTVTGGSFTNINVSNADGSQNSVTFAKNTNVQVDTIIYGNYNWISFNGGQFKRVKGPGAASQLNGDAKIETFVETNGNPVAIYGGHIVTLSGTNRVNLNNYAKNVAIDKISSVSYLCIYYYYDPDNTDNKNKCWSLNYDFYVGRYKGQTGLTTNDNADELARMGCYFSVSKTASEAGSVTVEAHGSGVTFQGWTTQENLISLDSLDSFDCATPAYTIAMSEAVDGKTYYACYTNPFVVGDTDYSTLKAAIAAAAESSDPIIEMVGCYEVPNNELGTNLIATDFTLKNNGHKLKINNARFSGNITVYNSGEKSDFVINGCTFKNDLTVFGSAEIGNTEVDRATLTVQNNDAKIAYEIEFVEGGAIPKIIAKGTGCLNVTSEETDVDSVDVDYVSDNSALEIKGYSCRNVSVGDNAGNVTLDLEDDCQRTLTVEGADITINSGTFKNVDYSSDSGGDTIINGGKFDTISFTKSIYGTTNPIDSLTINDGTFGSIVFGGTPDSDITVQINGGEFEKIDIQDSLSERITLTLSFAGGHVGTLSGINKIALKRASNVSIDKLDTKDIPIISFVDSTDSLKFKYYLAKEGWCRGDRDPYQEKYDIGFYISVNNSSSDRKLTVTAHQSESACAFAGWTNYVPTKGTDAKFVGYTLDYTTDVREVSGQITYYAYYDDTDSTHPFTVNNMGYNTLAAAISAAGLVSSAGDENADATIYTNTDYETSANEFCDGSVTEDFTLKATNTLAITDATFTGTITMNCKRPDNTKNTVTMSKCDFKAATITVNGYATVTNCKFGTVNVGKDNNDYRFITGGSDSVIKTIDLNGACESGSLFIKDECSIDTVNVTGNGNTADSSEIDIQGWLYDTSGEITNVNVYGNSKHVILGGVSVGTLKTINTSASNNIEVISASYNTLLVYGTKNHVDLVLDSNNKGSNTWASGNNEVYIWGGTYGTVKATSAVQVKEDVSEVYIDTLDVINTPTIIAGHIGTFKQRDSKGTYIHDFSVKLADKASDYNFHCEGDVSVAVKSDGNMTLTALPLEDGTKCSGWYTADNAGGLKLSGSATNYVAAGSSGGIYAYYGTAQEKPLWIIDPTQKKNASSNSINSIHFDLKRDFSDLSDLTITEIGFEYLNNYLMGYTSDNGTDLTKNEDWGEDAVVNQMLLEKKSRNSAATAENSGPFDETGTAHWNLRVGTNTNMYVYVLGYAKVEDSSSGNSYTLYTGVQAVKYSDLPVTAE